MAMGTARVTVRRTIFFSPYRCISVATGEVSWVDVFGGYVAPALLGNILGGVTLVAALNHVQVVAGSEDDEL